MIFVGILLAVAIVANGVLLGAFVGATGLIAYIFAIVAILVIIHYTN